MGYIAVIETGGKQYLVKPGDKIKVEKLEAEEGQKLTFEPLLIADDKDNEVKVGQPTIKGAKVTAVVVRAGRSRKVEVVKYKPKIRYRKLTGHRQHFTEIKIEDIKA
ncbi:50S ribosomal protein L21 [Patescibacteria group bacterium]|nr:50S ribosomal protein L21 [Patescibacteria group bacterium]MBU1028996.1 50S ribosomal protein L21 [Patescibacteria group bacterium]